MRDAYILSKAGRNSFDNGNSDSYNLTRHLPEQAVANRFPVGGAIMADPAFTTYYDFR